ncbi:transcription factor IIF subunit tfg1 [Cryptotrichosporon argae]
MADASVFLRKRKDKVKARVPSAPRAAAAAPASAFRAAAPPSAAASPAPKAEPSPSDIVEIQLFSAPPSTTQGVRHNLMRFNSLRPADPTRISRPVLMNRKVPGPRAPPQFVLDPDGRVVGRYLLDPEGKPVLGDDGKPVVEERRAEMDLTLVGVAPGDHARRRGRRHTREVFHQDVEVIRLRREEAQPWVLEAKEPKDKPEQPELWVGRMTEPSALPTVLLVNDGTGPSFTVVPLGRTYKFEPARPFKVMDPDEANKYFEAQAKYKVHDRWGQRQEDAGPSREGLEERASRIESHIQSRKGTIAAPRIKRETFDDDLRRERRQLGRGLEGDVDEELDYDVNDDFQDDDDHNTFYRNEEEEEEQRLHEERQKKEYRLANANVGDRPQIDDEGDDEDDLFGDGENARLTSEGKRLRKAMRKRAEEDGVYDSSDESSSSEDEQEHEKQTEKDKVPGSAERPSRPPSRTDRDRATASPSRRLPPTPERAATAGSGAALLAQRAASRGASPRRSGSPRAASPTPSQSGVREASPTPSSAGGLQPPKKDKLGKRKTTSESPLRESTPVGTPTTGAFPTAAAPQAAPKRKGSPAASETGSEVGKKKKKRTGSSTPTPGPDGAPSPAGSSSGGGGGPAAASFPGQITRQEVLDWLRAQGPRDIAMAEAIAVFSKRINATPAEHRVKNQKGFLESTKALTTKGANQTLRLRPEYA